MSEKKKTTSDYWDERANREYCYKNEKFYTITPIPYYYSRRKVILKKIEKLIEYKNYKSICDFGCGDGEYIIKLKKEGIKFYGIDASPKMIELAQARTSDITDIEYEVSSKGISIDQKFDLIYSSAIWAHINEEEVCKLYMNIHEHLLGEGSFIICEQVAPFYYEGNNYIRRTSEQYARLLKKAGFQIVKVETIDFWLHRILFEKHFVKKYVARKKYINRNPDEVKIELNKNKIYRFLSLLLTKLSIPHVFQGEKDNKIVNRWGYVFIIAKK